jgi:thiol-disulfide isomerase/thioredoxin
MTDITPSKSRLAEVVDEKRTIQDRPLSEQNSKQISPVAVETKDEAKAEGDTLGSTQPDLILEESSESEQIQKSIIGSYRLSEQSEKPVYLTELTDEKIINEKSLLAIMKPGNMYVCIFSSKKCSPCIKLKEYVSKSYSEYKHLTVFIYINCDDHHELCSSLDVGSIPDTRFYRNGKHIGNFIGGNIQGFSKTVKNYEK